MLTTEDRRTDDHVADADPRTPLRRAASRTFPLWGSLLLVFPGVAFAAFLLAAPLLVAVACLVLAATLVAHLLRRDWAAFAHVAWALGLLAVGYWTARAGIHAGLGTFESWSDQVRVHADRLTAAGQRGRATLNLGVSLVVACGYASAVLVASMVAAWGVIRVRTTRLPRGLVLGVCLVLGAAVGMIG